MNTYDFACAIHLNKTSIQNEIQHTVYFKES